MVRNTGASAGGGAGSSRTGRARVDEVRHGGGIGAGQAARRLHRSVELVGHRRLEQLDLGVPDSGLPEPLLLHQERVTRLPLLHLLRGAVALRITLVVAVPAVGRGLDDGGAPAGAGGQDGVVRDGCGGRDVVAVDRDVGDPVAGGALLERRRVLGGGRRELGVAVVLAEEDHRHLPYGGEVHGFVERALRRRAVTEEGHRDAAVRPELRRRRRAHGDGQARGDDAVRPEDPELRVGDVHGAPAAAVRALVLPHQLGEHADRVQALGQAVAVPAVRGGDDVRRAQRPARPDRRRLLPDGEVHEAGDLPVAVERGDPLLEPPDDQHPAVHLDEVDHREGGGRGETDGHGRCIVLVGTT